ncbi:hypothetical protein PO909_013498 [Leuciscus waleckii]
MLDDEQSDLRDAPFYGKMTSSYANPHYTKEQDVQMKQCLTFEEQISPVQTREQNLTKKPLSPEDQMKRNYLMQNQ